MSATFAPRSTQPRSARISKFKTRRGSSVPATIAAAVPTATATRHRCGKSVAPVSADVAIVVGNSRVIVRCSQVARKQQSANASPTWTNTFSTADIDAAIGDNFFPSLVLHVQQFGNRHFEPPYSYYDCI